MLVAIVEYMFDNTEMDSVAGAGVAALDVAAMPTERLEACVSELAAHLAAATCRFLLMVGELDRRRAWAATR
jgi:hypothetical protein